MFRINCFKLVGMKTYPLELRRRIVNAVDLQEWTIAQIAEMFNVTERYVYKLLVQRNETGDVVPRPHGGGAPAKLDEPRILKLNELIAAQPDATLAELCQKLNQRRRQKVSISTVCRGLQKIALTRKKSPAVHAKRIRQNVRPSQKNS
ncbi:MAG: helix-turn-helix domain-containing protein [Nitrososphaerales archaeon]